MNGITRILILIVSVLSIAGCKKEADRKALGAHFSYTACGNTIEIKEGVLLNENHFRCRITGDTALQIIVSKVYDGAGFFITDETGVKNGTYVLNEENKAYYVSPKDYKRYSTTRNSAGSLTIKKGTFQRKSLLQTLESTFSFNATDTVTRKTIAVTGGIFFMELKN